MKEGIPRYVKLWPASDTTIVIKSFGITLNGIPEKDFITNLIIHTVFIYCGAAYLAGKHV